MMKIPLATDAFAAVVKPANFRFQLRNLAFFVSWHRLTVVINCCDVAFKIVLIPYLWYL